MNKKDIDKIRKRLEEEKVELQEEVAKIKEREKTFLNDEVGDEVDKASGDFQREMLFYTTDHDRQKLDLIEEALHKIEHDRYGTCENCGKKISKDRLYAIPYVRDCIKCKP